MSVMHIKQSVESVIDHYAARPGKARGPGTIATAVTEKGLRSRVQEQVYRHRSPEQHRDHRENYLRASGSRYVSPVR